MQRSRRWTPFENTLEREPEAFNLIQYAPSLQCALPFYHPKVLIQVRYSQKILLFSNHDSPSLATDTGHDWRQIAEGYQGIVSLGGILNFTPRPIWRRWCSSSRSGDVYLCVLTTTLELLRGLPYRKGSSFAHWRVVRWCWCRKSDAAIREGR